MGLIITGYQLIPFADGVNPMDATMWEIKYFIFPFLSHTIGTLSGAFIVAKYTVSHHMILAICIGVFFLLGGISMVFIIPAPSWSTENYTSHMYGMADITFVPDS